MKHTPEQLALQHTFAVCQGHADALQDALQDDMGARLVPAVLKALGEDVAPMSALDRFGRLEQLGWLPSADEWMALRQVLRLLEANPQMNQRELAAALGQAGDVKFLFRSCRSRAGVMWQGLVELRSVVKPLMWTAM